MIGNRENELKKLCDNYRKSDGSYDCIVPGSGGKDSSFTAHILKYKYGMNPLTVTWAPHKYTDIGWKILKTGSILEDLTMYYLHQMEFCIDI